MNERRTPAENMAIMKMYGGCMFADILDLEETPLDKLKNNPSGLSGEENYGSSMALNQSKRESLCNFNEPPVKARPQFRKYGVNDFRFLKVLGNVAIVKETNMYTKTTCVHLCHRFCT